MNGALTLYLKKDSTSIEKQVPEQLISTKFSTFLFSFYILSILRTLLYGGIFLYPADKKNSKGKLRVLYEGFPMSLIIEQAGGLASTGMFNGKIQRVLELHPSNIHDKCPIIMGSPSMYVSIHIVLLFYVCELTDWDGEELLLKSSKCVKY